MVGVLGLGRDALVYHQGVGVGDISTRTVTPIPIRTLQNILLGQIQRLIRLYSKQTLKHPKAGKCPAAPTRALHLRRRDLPFTSPILTRWESYFLWVFVAMVNGRDIAIVIVSGAIEVFELILTPICEIVDGELIGEVEGVGSLYGLAVLQKDGLS